MKGFKKVWDEYGDEALTILAVIAGVIIAKQFIM